MRTTCNFYVDAIYFSLTPDRSMLNCVPFTSCAHATHQNAYIIEYCSTYTRAGIRRSQCLYSTAQITCNYLEFVAELLQITIVNGGVRANCITSQVAKNHNSFTVRVGKREQINNWIELFSFLLLVLLLGSFTFLTVTERLYFDKTALLLVVPMLIAAHVVCSARAHTFQHKTTMFRSNTISCIWIGVR